MPDPIYNSTTCDVEARDAAGSLIYQDGPFGTRWGGNVCLWAAGALLFGGSCFSDSPGRFGGSVFFQNYPVYRDGDVGFGVVSA